MSKNKILRISLIGGLPFLIIWFLVSNGDNASCYYKVDKGEHAPLSCIEAMVTIKTGRDEFESTFVIPDSYFREMFNKEGSNYRRIMLDYIYPEMIPLKPNKSDLNEKIASEFKSYSDRNNAFQLRTLGLNVSGYPGPIDEERIDIRNHLVGEILEHKGGYTKYGKTNLKPYDYHLWIEREGQYPVLIACLKDGRCTIQSSFNETVGYEFDISEELLESWQDVDKLVKMEIRRFKKKKVSDDC